MSDDHVGQHDASCKQCHYPSTPEPPQPIDADMIAAALEATLNAYDAAIGWRPGTGYDHGNPPSVEQVAKGIAARLPL